MKNSYLSSKIISLLISLVLLIVVFSIMEPAFISGANIINLILQSSVLIVLGLGATFVVATGGIDLSIGSTTALIAMIIAMLITNGISVFSAILVGLICAIVFGMINATLISKLRIPAFITTLGMLAIARGLTLTISGGRSVSILEISLPLGTIFPISITLLILISISWYLMNKTHWGIRLLAIGSDTVVAKQSGINIHSYARWVYVISSLSAAFAAIILVSRLGGAQPSLGFLYELSAVTIVLIGGTRLDGGKASIVGTVLAALMIGIISNGLSITNTFPYLQHIIIGTLLILTLIFDKKTLFYDNKQ